MLGLVGPALTRLVGLAASPLMGSCLKPPVPGSTGILKIA